MPTIIQTQQSIVTGLWGGNALIRGSDGVMRVLKMGDVVRKGDVILTTQDGIVRLSQEGEVVQAVDGTKPSSVAQRVLGTETDRVIAALEQNQADAATAAGLAGGADGSNLGEGLRVGRVDENIAGSAAPGPSAQGFGGNSAGSNVATQNTPPTAQSNSVTGNEDTTLPIALIGSDSDGVVASVRVISVPTGGTLLNNGVPVVPGSILSPVQAANLQFQPNANLNGNPGSVVFAVTDDQGTESTPGTVTLLLLPVADAPASSADFASTPEDTPLNLPAAALLANDVDVDGDTLTIISVQNPTNGTVALVGTNVIFTPAPNYFGPATFTYTVSDGTGLTSTATVFVNVTPVNDAPVAANDFGSTLVNTAIAFAPGTLLANDSDIDGGALGIVSVQNPVNGSVSIVGGSPVFTPAPGYVGPASFTYTISDGNGGTATATVNIDVTVPPPPPPPATPGLSINDVTVNEGAGTATFTVTLSPAATGVVTVNFTTSSGTAISGTDFSEATGTLNFPIGTTTRTITVPINNDSIAEGTETFTVTLSGATGASIADGIGIGTIIDNDAAPVTPSLSVTAAPVTEGGLAVFTVNLSNTSTSPVVFTPSLSNGSALIGTDTSAASTLQFFDGTTWVTVSGNVTIPAGNSSIQLRIQTSDDLISEGPETFSLTATPVSGSTLTPASATATITDNDGTPTVSISGPATVDEAAGTVTYTVTLSAASASNVTVNYGTTNGTALSGPGNDYTATSGTITFTPGGPLTQTFTVPINNDTVFEGAETYSVNLTSPVGATLGTASVTSTIVDDGRGLPGGGTANNDTPSLSVTAAPVTEGGLAVFTVNLSNTSTSPVVFTPSLSNGSALIGTDTSAASTLQFFDGTTWVTVSGNVTIPAGNSSIQLRIQTSDDLISEGPETFSLTATPVSGSTLTPASATATITDNDGAPTVSISGPATVDEAAGTVTYTVTLSAASATNVSVNYGTTNGTALSGPGNDYTATSGTITFTPGGPLTQTFTVPINNDTVFEGAETYSVNLTSPVGATLGTASVTSTIVDDGRGLPGGGTANNDTPSLSVTAAPVTEGGLAVFTVNLSNTSTSPVVFTPSLSNGSALIGTDTSAASTLQFFDGTTWVTVSGNVTIPAGNSSIQLRIQTSDDLISEGPETFSLTATPVSGSTLTPASATATITDNDGAPTVSISGPATVDEAAGTVTYTVTLSAASATNVSVNYGTTNGTALSGPGNDYTATSGTITFTPGGPLTQTFTVPINNDTVFEGAETYSVNLTSPVGATLGTASVTSTIVDDGRGLPGGGTANNDTPSLSVTAAPVTEGGLAVFTVNLSNTSTSPVVFTPSLSNGSALIGTDTSAASTLQFFDGTTWVTVSGNVTIPAGNSSIQLRIQTSDDLISEGPETFSLTATPVSGSTLTPASATATITDNDGAPTVSISGPATVDEAAGTVTYTVTLSAASATNVSVNYGTTNGTALSGPGNDYTATSGTITFTPGGPLTQTFTVPINNDTVFEGAETYSVNLTSPVGATLGTASVTSTIVDDGRGLPGGGTANNDTPSLSVTAAPVTEGGLAVFTVNLSNTSTSPVVFTPSLSNGSALIGTDTSAASTLQFFDGTTWVTVSGNVTIPAGNSSIQLRIQTSDDLISEGPETFSLTATPVSGSTLTPASATATITDNDGTPTVSVNDVTVNESAGFATFTITLSGPSATSVSVNYATSNGTALSGPGNDYTTASGTATFTPGGPLTQTFTVPINNDTANESNETFNVTLSVPVNTTILDGSGVGTILDNDARNVTKVTVEDTPATFTAADFGLVAGDTGVRIDTTAPGAGQLLLNGTPVGAGIVVSVADINAGLLTYSPAGNGPTSTNLSGNNYATFTFSVRDSNNVFDLVPNNVTINVTPDADTPTISVAPATVTPPLPASQGLTWQFTPNLPGADSTNAGNTAVVEAAIDAAGGTSTLVTNVFLSGNSFPNGIGSPAGLGSEAGGQNDPTITNTDNAHQFTGFVFLEAGQTATFSGFRDDTMRIELGGSTVFDQGFNTWGPFSSTGFTATATGFYSVEIVYYNGDGPGGLNVNFSTGGAAQDLSTSNFVLMPNAAAVTALGSGVVGSLVPNGEPGAGYYPAIFTSSTWVDLATTVNFPDNDGSETRNITVTGLPAGFELRDGVNTITSTGGAINITTWNLANLEARPAAGYTGTATLTFTATATEQGNSDTASSTDTVTLTVTPTTVSALDAPLSGAMIAKTAFDAPADESATSKSHAEVFAWHLADSANSDQHQGPNIDVINDFQVQADSLDLRDLLVGESHLGQDLGNLANFLSVSVVGGDTEIRISSTGGFQDGQYNSSAEDQRIVLDNVDLVASLSLTPESSNHDIIAAMLNNGKLITD